MADLASQVALLPEETRVMDWLLSLNCSPNIAGPLARFVLLQREMVAQVASTNPTYLQLPASLSALSADWRYQAGLPYGRFQYRDEQYAYVEETKTLVRCPRHWTRPDLGEMIRSFVLPADPKLLAAVPLSWRVGFLVGWLSGLAVSQREDAQAGMVVLAALVAPLLVGAAAATTETNPAVTKLAPAVTKLGAVTETGPSLSRKPGKHHRARARRSGSAGRRK